MPLASAGTIVVAKGTISASEEIIPTTSFFSVNSSLAIPAAHMLGSNQYMSLIKMYFLSSAHLPSKHFLRWGWTLRGSLVSDKISNSSSLDRKKNLGLGLQCYRENT